MVLAIMLPGGVVQGQADPPPAPIVNDEGGPEVITGSVSYTNAFFTTGTAMPMVILEDQAGFIDRNLAFILPVESQTLGQITSDFYDSPFTYSVALPLAPQGTLRDVDNDAAEEPGVMVFAVAYWTNIFGDPYLEERDLFGGGWSTAYASTRVSTSVETRREIIGGTLLVYAPDDQQGFPSGFGADGLLFTQDDPVVTLPQGYTVVNMDQEPFIFDRSRRPTIDLIEPERAALADFSALTYSQAFDELVEKLRREYAFTEYKQIDWDALYTEFRPRFAAAQEGADRLAYRRALRDFAFAIPDGHVSGPLVVQDFRYATGGGLGMSISDVDDGRVLVSYLMPDGPAAQAGIEPAATILAIDGIPVDSYVDNTLAWSAPFSSDHHRRLQQLRYAVRRPVETQVAITYRNPGQEVEETVTLTAIAERESFSHSSFNTGLTGFELPLEYERLENGLGYVKIYSFSDNELLTIQLWERMIRTLRTNNVPGLIVDMRQNSGGSGFLADQMAAYFFNEQLELGNSGRYDPELDAFYFDPRTVERFYLPPVDLRYNGALAVLVGPNCNSACEFFAYDLTLENRAAVVGQYPTAGLGGSVDVVLMPEQEFFQFTAGRAVDMNGEIHVEGKGVQPTVRVPVTEETLFDNDDPVLQAASAFLEKDASSRTVDGGDLTAGAVVTGKLEPGVRVRYRLAADTGVQMDLYLEDPTGMLDTVLRVYDAAGALLWDNDDAPGRNTANSALEDLSMPDDGLLIVEVGTYQDSRTGDYILSVVDAEGAGMEPPVAAIDSEGESPGASDQPEAAADTPAVDETATAAAEPITAAAVAVASVTATTPVSPTVAGVVAGPTVPPTASDVQTPEVVADESSASPETNADTAADPQAEPAANEELGVAVVTTQGARLAVRAAPTTDSARLGYLANGSSHTILAGSAGGDWLLVVFENEEGVATSGWIAAAYVTIQPAP